ncbi:MAG: hypothetical protein AAFR61_03635 [Bacteroidota bacterium]
MPEDRREPSRCKLPFGPDPTRVPVPHQLRSHTSPRPTLAQHSNTGFQPVYALHPPIRVDTECSPEGSRWQDPNRLEASVTESGSASSRWQGPNRLEASVTESGSASSRWQGRKPARSQCYRIRIG